MSLVVTGPIDKINSNLTKLENKVNNIKMPFIDASSIITTLTFSGTSTFKTWVATEDCILGGVMYSDGNSAIIRIDGIEVGYVYSNSGGGVYLPIKAGQTITYRGTTRSSVSAFKFLS